MYAEIAKLIEENRTFAVAVVIKAEGSTPGKIGFKLIVLETGETVGTIGGGAIEKKVIEDALIGIKNGNSFTKNYILTENDFIDETGSAEIVNMMCNGEVSVYYEVYAASPSVYIFGAGHVGSALVKILSNLPYRVTIIDNREGFADADKLKGASEYVFDDYLNYAKNFSPVENSYCVILTHGHKFDYDIAKILFERELPVKYVGVIGSKSKSSAMKENLRKELKNKFREEIYHSPIGLKIGGDSASEIALSVAAEIQAVRNEKTIKY